MCVKKIQLGVLYGVFTLPKKSKIIKHRRNIFKIDSEVSTKLSLSSSLLLLSVAGLTDSNFDDPVFGIILLI